MNFLEKIYLEYYLVFRGYLSRY